MPFLPKHPVVFLFFHKKGWLAVVYTAKVTAGFIVMKSSLAKMLVGGR
jgi:hypothetical protein